MRNYQPQTIQLNRSLALSNDAHLSKFKSKIEVFEDCLKFNNYAYIDFEVVSGGAIFFFAPYESFVSKNWDCKDTLEIYVEFIEQRYYKQYYSEDLAHHYTRNYHLINNDHERFNMDRAMAEAELKAFEFINKKNIVTN